MRLSIDSPPLEEDLADLLFNSSEKGLPSMPSTSDLSLSNHKHSAPRPGSMPFDAEPLILTEEERQELQQMRSRGCFRRPM